MNLWCTTENVDGLERWFAAAGAPPRLDLARSSAPTLSTAELLALAPPEVTEAYLRLPLDYGPGEGTLQLREAVAASGAARSAAQVVITHGAVEALLLVSVASLDIRRRVAVATPAYEQLLAAPEAAGAEVVAVPVWRAGSKALDLGGFGDKLVEDCSAIILNLPHNPTGLVADPYELAALAERCGRAATLLIIDEVARGTLDPGAPSLAEGLAFRAGGLVVIGDVSKALGLGGLRVGWVSCADPELIARVRSLKDQTSLGNATPSQFLATLALAHRAALGVSDLAARNVETMQAWVGSIPGATWARPVDGLVALVRLPLVEPSVVVAQRLRADAGVSVLPGSLFGAEGHLRLGLGQGEHDLAEALDRISSTLGLPG